MRKGARIIKTGLAVAGTMLICKLLNLEPAFFGAVSAVINVQPSVFLTLKTARDQVLVHVLGVGIAIPFGYVFGGSPAAMGVITIVIILLYKRLNLHSSISTGVVAAVFILSSSPDQFLPHAVDRTAVIFVGLVTAMAINIILWPPRYADEFRFKLNQSNQKAVRYFCQALRDYVELEDREPPDHSEDTAGMHSLNKDVRGLATLLLKEGEPLLGPVSSQQGDWFALAKKFMDYNESLTEKADRIYELLSIRYERRLLAGSLPISQEFRTILELLGSGCGTVERINAKLRAAIIEGISVEPEEINEEYWEKLMQAIEQWQPRITGSYYFHALIEVSVTANEIKSAVRQGKRLLLETQEKSPD